MLTNPQPQGSGPWATLRTTITVLFGSTAAGGVLSKMPPSYIMGILAIVCSTFLAITFMKNAGELMVKFGIMYESICRAKQGRSKPPDPEQP